jgi:hypothetical protein
MDRIRELLGRITDLSDQELSELRDLVLQVFQETDSGAGDVPDDATMGLLSELANITQAVRSEIGTRNAARRDRANISAELAAGIESLADSTPADTSVPEQAAAPETEAAPAEDADAEDTNKDKDKVAVTAAATNGPTGVSLHIEPPADRRPKPVETRATVVASADVPGVPMGTAFADELDVAGAMVRRIDSLRHANGGDGEQVVVASIRTEWPDDRHLKNADPEANYRKVVAVTKPTAIVAAGGMCAPFVSPTKPVLRVACGAEVVVNTQAVTVGLVFGNMQSRAYPELVARHTDLAMVAHARVAEQQLLAQIGALSLKVTTGTQVVGAARHLLSWVDRALAGYRNRYRTGPLPIRLIFPLWFKDELRADIVQQLPGDGMEVFARGSGRAAATSPGRSTARRARTSPRSRTTRPSPGSRPTSSGTCSWRERSCSSTAASSTWASSGTRRSTPRTTTRRSSRRSRPSPRSATRVCGSPAPSVRPARRRRPSPFRDPEAVGGRTGHRREGREVI